MATLPLSGMLDGADAALGALAFACYGAWIVPTLTGTFPFVAIDFSACTVLFADLVTLLVSAVARLEGRAFLLKSTPHVKGFVDHAALLITCATRNCLSIT